MVGSRALGRALRGPLLLVLLALSPCLVAETASSPAFGIRGLWVDLPVFSIFARPGESMELKLAQEARQFSLSLEGGPLGEPHRNRWRFRAPRDPGIYPLQLRRGAGGAVTEINLFVGYPVEAIRDGALNGYLIGPLPPSHRKYPPLYRPPEVYFEVTDESADTQLSPHFTLRQFLCKQEADFPKYLVLQESLLLLLEGLVGAVQDAGYPVTTLGVISGYRTPWYNKSIGNVSNSRHVYGDAFDFYVDVDGDGRMDDLDGNGRRDRGDVDRLAAIVDEFMHKPGNRPLLGGLGRYYKTSLHGGFVHADTRGFLARW